jgi:hypothetical protein
LRGYTTLRHRMTPAASSMNAMSLRRADRTVSTESQDQQAESGATTSGSAPSGDAAAAQDLGQLAQHLTNGHAVSAPETAQNAANGATAASDSFSGVAATSAPVLNLPPSGHRAEAAPQETSNNGSGSRGAEGHGGAGQYRSARLDRATPRQAPVRSVAMEEQFRAISAKLPRLLEQALHELETRSKIEFDRKWAASATALEQRLTEMNQRLNEGLPGMPAGAAATASEGSERLRKENREQRRRLGFYKAALCLLCGAFLLVAVLFASFSMSS